MVKLGSSRLHVPYQIQANMKVVSLEFQFRNQDDPTPKKKCVEILPRGSICVFPSFVWHEVKPVTKGIRYSLVIWNR